MGNYPPQSLTVPWRLSWHLWVCNSQAYSWGSSLVNLTSLLDCLILVVMFVPWAMSGSFKSSVCLFLLFHALPGLQSDTMCLYNHRREQPEDSWPSEGKYCLITNPSEYSAGCLSCVSHNMCNRTSLSEQLKVSGRILNALSLSIEWHQPKGSGLPR